MQKIKVLVVDDEEQMYNLLKITVTPLGFDFHYATSEQDVIDAIKSQSIDVAIIDYLMPIKNGMQVASEIREADGLDNLPIVFLTSKELVHEETKKLMSLKLDYMRKPFVPQVISAKLKEVVSRR
ncbi:MAG: response regulator transcription factor [Planctomycetes bacterium]|nr:response regulator transcription factor [Planctomycetota bacterium]